MQLGKTSRYLHKAASDYLLSASTKINFMWIELPSNSSFFQTDFLNAIGHGAVCDFCAISPIPSSLFMSPNVSARLPVCTCCHLCVPLPPLSSWMPSPSLLPNGTVGPMNRCLEYSRLRCRGPSISRKKELQILESAPLIQTILHKLGSLQMPPQQKMAAGRTFQPKTLPSSSSPSPPFCSVSVHLVLISVFTFHFLLLSLPPAPFPPPSP